MTEPSVPFHRTVSRTVQRVDGAATADLSVMAFNVLARSLQRAPETTDPAALRALDFDHRKRLNLDHVLALRPTVCVLLEVDEPDEFYAPPLRVAGYDVVADRKNGGARDFTCVFFARERLELLRHRTFRMRDGQSQFVVCCHFRSRDAARPVEFVLVAQHAKAGRTEDAESIRFDHARAIVNEVLPEFVRGHENELGARVVWAGDFNASPHTYGGRYPARVVPWLLHEDGAPSEIPPCPVVFRSATKDFTGAHPLFTTCKRRDGALIVQTIDYVLFADGACRCVGHLPCPSNDPERDLAPLFLPNERWGSDHLSVHCELRWLP